MLSVDGDANAAVTIKLSSGCFKVRSLTNHVTHLCKCNDVADQTSII